jgi:hypothetical protein
VVEGEVVIPKCTYCNASLKYALYFIKCKIIKKCLIVQFCQRCLVELRASLAVEEELAQGIWT